MAHDYDGISHTQPGPFEDCLMCRIEALERELAKESLRDGYLRWLLDRDPDRAAKLIEIATERERA